MFLVPLVTARAPTVDRVLFRSRNLMTGVGFMLVVGAPMTAKLALLPPMLQALFNYQVLTTGLMLMPRGVGIVGSMWVADS